MKHTNKLSNRNKLQINKKSLSGWLTLAILFLLLALITGTLGLGLISGMSYIIAKWLAIIFVILFIISVIAHTIKRA